MQVVITASGSDMDNFLQAGFTLPKNLVNFKGTPILDFVIRQYESLSCPITVTLKSSECKDFHTDQIIQESHPRVRILKIPDGNHGALCSALMGIDTEISGPLLVVPGDSVCPGLTEAIVESFISKNADAGTAVFSSSNSKWSYVRTDGRGQIIEIAEKKVISQFATTGFFYFANVTLFLDGATWALVNSTNLQGRYFVSHGMHKLLSTQKRVFAFELENPKNYLSFSSPAELALRLEEHEDH
jgi:NDP-sugar pyrophosphorylase family protein